MSTTVTFNAIQYIVPSYNDTGYAQGNGNLSSYLVALSTGTLQQSGGLFQLTADADFGPNFGLKALYLKSETATPATAGVLRLAKTDTIDFRNNGGGGNLALGINGSDQLTFNSVVLLTPGVTVAQGGTGVTSMTAYAVLCGGTTSTGAVQSIAGVGSSGQVLTSNGAGALPTFQNVAGTGTVNSGTAGQLTYYASSTNAVSGMSALVMSTNELQITGAVSTAFRGNLTLYDSTALAAGIGGQIALGGHDTAGGYTEWASIQVQKANSTSGNEDSNLIFRNRSNANGMVTALTFDASQSATFVGTILAPAGLVGGPAFSFSADQNTGIYRIGADDLAFATGGVKALEINATQQVDIANTKQTVGGNQVFPIVQIVTATNNQATTTSSTTFVDTNLTASITPKFNTSKILIMVNGFVAASGSTDSIVMLTRGASTTLLSNGFDIPTGTKTGVPLQFYDSPATTSATTYKVQIKVSGATSTGVWGSTATDSIMTLMEIAQ